MTTQASYVSYHLCKLKFATDGGQIVEIPLGGEQCQTWPNGLRVPGQRVELTRAGTKWYVGRVL